MITIFYLTTDLLNDQNATINVTKAKQIATTKPIKTAEPIWPFINMLLIVSKIYVS